MSLPQCLHFRAPSTITPPHSEHLDRKSAINATISHPIGPSRNDQIKPEPTRPLLLPMSAPIKLQIKTHINHPKNSIIVNFALLSGLDVKMNHNGPKTVNREAELTASSGVGDLLRIVISISSAS